MRQCKFKPQPVGAAGWIKVCVARRRAFWEEWLVETPLGTFFGRVKASEPDAIRRQATSCLQVTALSEIRRPLPVAGGSNLQ